MGSLCRKCWHAADVAGSVQEISDDLGRHRSDAQINNSGVTVLRGHEEVISQWKHLQPGDLVKVCITTEEDIMDSAC